MDNNKGAVDMQEQTYSLRTNEREYKNSELSTRLFEEILYNFNPDVYDFMVLAPDKPIKGSNCIQVTSQLKNLDFKHNLQVCFYDEKNQTGILYNYDTTDKNIILQYFNDYWREQKIPDISSWEKEPF